MEKLRILKRAAVVVVVLLSVLYIVWVIIQANINNVKTETASVTTVPETIDAVGYFIREEQYITQKDKGFVSYIVENGGKVSKDEAVANIFANSEEANNKLLMDRLQTELLALEQLQQSSDTLSATPDGLDKHIDTLLTTLNLNVVKRDFSEVNENVTSVLYDLNERQIVTGTVVSFSDKIKALKSRITELEQRSVTASTGKQAISPAAGYFTNKVDGYENAIKVEDIETIMPGDIDPEKISKKNPPENVIGRVAKGVDWYIASQVSAEEAQILQNRENLSVQIPVVSNQKIDVRVVSVNQKDKASEAIVILKGSFMNGDVINLRYENISIVLNSYKGIYIPKTAVHEIPCTYTEADGEQQHQDNLVKGVYIRIGNEIQFKRIVPMYTGDNFVIAEMRVSEKDLPSIEEGYGPLMVNDEIVVEGVNLYDGKIISPKGTSI